ncbi:hypothetical protein ADT27_06795, partial [Xanthomonas oryzae]
MACWPAWSVITTVPPLMPLAVVEVRLPLLLENPALAPCTPLPWFCQDQLLPLLVVGGVWVSVFPPAL